MTAERILCVEDDPSILRSLEANLTARGYVVDVAESGESALGLAAANHPDLYIVDLGLPGISGTDVIHELRRWTQAPILVLSARQLEDDKIAALDAGADDYVTKPFGMGELLARLRAALRRTHTADDVAEVVTEHFTIDRTAKRVLGRAGDEIRLTPIEWHIVELLVRHAGRLVSSREILQEVWGPQYGTETNYLRVHLAHIRRKLEPEPGRPRYFHTESGMGYRFEMPRATPRIRSVNNRSGVSTCSETNRAAPQNGPLLNG